MSVTQELKKYLHSLKFRDELVRQYRRFEILSEAGLRTAVANLLRAKILALGNPAKGYRVVCEQHLLAGKRLRPDILIWKNRHPRIWIELKDSDRFVSKKAEDDRQKLQDYCKLCSFVKSGYLIYVARRDDRVFGIKRNNQTRRYWTVGIALEPHIRKFEEFEEWTAEYSRRAHYKFPKQKARSASA
jgi:hypothetical protein